MTTRSMVLLPLLVRVVVVVAVAILLIPVVHGQSMCRVCAYGPDQIPDPTQALSVDGLPVDSCGTLEASAGLFDTDTALCHGIQAVGALCGCNTPPVSCSLCLDNKSVAANGDTVLEEYSATQFIPVAQAGIPLTCSTLEAVLQMTVSDTSEQCLQIQQDVGEKCGCPPPTLLPSDKNASTTIASPPPISSNTTTGTTIPTNAPISSPATTTTFAPTKAPCSVCPNGEPVGFPVKPILLGDTLPIDSCGTLEAFAVLFGHDTEECMAAQSMAKYCGCAIPDEACSLCPNGKAPSNPTRKLNWFQTLVLDLPVAYQTIADELTCELMDSIVAASDVVKFDGMEEALFCTASQLQSWICGCEPDWKQIASTWCWRVSGMLSLLGSVFIIVDVMMRRENRSTAYHQLVLGISIFDSIGSIAYILVGVMAPVEAGYYLSRGNDTTCKVQGFMIQLGLTSMFYNLCLTLYFLLVISFNWKERQFKRLLPWVHGTVIVTGTVMSLASLPFIGPQLGVCFIAEPPSAPTYWPKTILYTVPMSIVLVVLLSATIKIYHTVAHQQKKARKWSMEHNKGILVTRRVFWQSFFYVLAFYMSLPFLLLSFYIPFRTANYIYMFLLVAILGPIQGFTNFLVYMHRSRFGFFRSLCKCERPNNNGRSGVVKNYGGGDGEDASDTEEQGRMAIVPLSPLWQMSFWRSGRSDTTLQDATDQRSSEQQQRRRESVSGSLHLRDLDAPTNNDNNKPNDSQEPDLSLSPSPQPLWRRIIPVSATDRRSSSASTVSLGASGETPRGLTMTPSRRGSFLGLHMSGVLQHLELNEPQNDNEQDDPE